MPPTEFLGPHSSRRLIEERTGLLFDELFPPQKTLPGKFSRSGEYPLVKLVVVRGGGRLDNFVIYPFGFHRSRLRKYLRGSRFGDACPKSYLAQCGFPVSVTALRT